MERKIRYSVKGRLLWETADGTLYDITTGYSPARRQRRAMRAAAEEALRWGGTVQACQLTVGTQGVVVENVEYGSCQLPPELKDMTVEELDHALAILRRRREGDD